MQWVKAAIVGAAGSLVMFGVMMVAIHGIGVAPFNTPPSAAFLVKLGLPAKPLALIVHFGYGIFWSLVFVALFRSQMSIARGLGLAGALWLVMMVLYSPIIGWGVAGFGAVARAATDPLYLGSPVKYVLATALLHVIYGLIVGWLNPLWINRGAGQRSDQPAPAA